VLTVTAAGFAQSSSVEIKFNLTNQDSVREASDVTVEVIQNAAAQAYAFLFQCNY